MIIIPGIISNGKIYFYVSKTGTKDLTHHNIKGEFMEVCEVASPFG